MLVGGAEIRGVFDGDQDPLALRRQRAREIADEGRCLLRSMHFTKDDKSRFALSDPLPAARDRTGPGRFGLRG